MSSFWRVTMAAALTCAAWGAERTTGSRNALVRVVTISQDGAKPDADGTLMGAALDRLRESEAFRPDVAVLPELFARGPGEPVPGPTTEKLAEWARKNRAYVIAGLKKSSGGRIYNTAVLLDREGRLAGQFDKMHPTEPELAAGITPGAATPPVFQTDFGKIGIQICFDVNWWANWAQLKEQGVRMVFFPAAYPAAVQLSALALTNEFFVVSSAGRGASRIYDITGQVIAQSGQYQHWAGTVVPLGRRLFEIDFNAKNAREAARKYGSKVSVEWYHDDDWFTLASLDPDLTVEDLQKEFGLTPLEEYRKRAAKAVEAARPPQAGQ